jgi:hypothetical protein
MATVTEDYHPLGSDAVYSVRILLTFRFPSSGSKSKRIKQIKNILLCFLPASFLHSFSFLLFIVFSRYSDGLDGRGSNPRQGQDCSLLHSVQTDCENHQASYPMGTGGDFTGCNVVGAWSWPFTSVQCRGQEWWSCTSTPPHVFMAWCLIS